MGCLRTLNEIKGWVFLQPAAQWSLVEELAERRAAQDVQQNKQKSP
jgi:predicted Fe-S protein YdhL (DUF1289 family)